MLACLQMRIVRIKYGDFSFSGGDGGDRGDVCICPGKMNFLSIYL
jgi:hypothetical protein